MDNLDFGTEISNALCFAISKGYQIHPDAFEMLKGLDIDILRIIQDIIKTKVISKDNSIILVEDIKMIVDKHSKNGEYQNQNQNHNDNDQPDGSQPPVGLTPCRSTLSNPHATARCSSPPPNGLTLRRSRRACAQGGGAQRNYRAQLCDLGVRA